MTVHRRNEAPKATVGVLGFTHQPDNSRRHNYETNQQNPLRQKASAESVHTGDAKPSPETEENVYSSLLSGMLGSTGTYGQGIVARTCTGIWAETSGGI